MKTFGFLASLGLALAALAGAGTASATELTCAGGAMCITGTTIHAESEGPIVIHTTVQTVECKGSTIGATTSNTGGLSETVVAPIAVFTLSECNCSVVVLKKGSLEIHTTVANANNNGTVTHSGKEITIECLGFHCIYGSSGSTDIGDLTGSATTGATATIDVSGTTPRTGGRSGAFCGSSDLYTGSYKITSPDTLNVD